MAFSNTLLSLTKISSFTTFPNLSMMNSRAIPRRFRTFYSYPPKESGKRKNEENYDEFIDAPNGNYEQPQKKIGKCNGNYEQQTPKKVKVEEGGAECLSDLVEKEGEEYLRKLREKSSSEIELRRSTHELAKSGAMLSAHAEEIKQLGLLLLSVSIDRLKSNP